MFRRDINISTKQSFFLFGARGTGKSTILRQRFRNPEDALWVDLLLPSEFDRLLRNPESLLEQIRALPQASSWVVLDEVQRVPELLNVVHYAIEEFKTKFALSGSSARKLKRGGANLLAGRAVVHNLFPLTHLELGEHFNLADALNVGTLPKIFELAEERDRNDFLTSYAHTYLREEIIAEQIIRTLPPFRKFLEIAAQMNGAPLNYAAIARDVGVDDKTIKNYFLVLEDTLIGFFLEPFHRSVRKTQTEAPRFFLFDPGVKRALEGTLSSRLLPRTYGWGKAFEHFVIAECFRLNSYLRKDFRFSFLRTQSGTEVDLIIERPSAPTAIVKIKSTTEASSIDVKHIKSISSDIRNCTPLLLSLDPNIREIDGVRCVPWQSGIIELGFSE